MSEHDVADRDDAYYGERLDPRDMTSAQLSRWLADPERERERSTRLVQERNQTIKHAVRKAGGARAEAYAMAERMQDVLGQAHRETEDREARRALSEAGVHYRKMRDEIVRALGIA